MKPLFTFLTAVLITATLWAQSPQKMSYQAIVRDASDDLVVNEVVGMQISILQGSASGTVVYEETQFPVTNANGLVSLEIGTGTTTDDFSTIDWTNGPYFIMTETDPSGGTNYTITGTSQLLSVPYALYAEKSGGSDMWNKNYTNELYYTDGNVGIGTDNPSYELDIRDDDGEAYARIRSEIASSSLIIDKFSRGQMAQIAYQHGHVNKFHTGLLGNNNYRISTDRFSLNGLEVQESGNVVFSDGLTLSNGAGEGKVLTSDAGGNATWQGGPTEKYLSIPGMGFHNTSQIDYRTRHSDSYTMAFGADQHVNLQYPVSLPHGAVITGIRITVFDYTENNISIKLYYDDLTATSLPSTGDLIVNTTSSGTLKQDKYFYADLSGVDPYDLTIDKDRTYFLKAHWYSGSNYLYMALKQVLITYIE